jgi:hypothetical protein
MRDPGAPRKIPSDPIRGLDPASPPRRGRVPFPWGRPRLERISSLLTAEGQS